MFSKGCNQQMTESNPKPKRLNLLGALGDLTILVLLIAGAGFAGYYIGINQRLAPIQMVWPGTPGAVPLSAILGPQDNVAPAAAATTSPASSATLAAPAAPATPAAAADKPAAPAANKPQASKGKTKFWLTSSGADGYVGYSITVKVNGETVDNFFGSGKTIDVSKHVKKGQNTLEFECKNMGEDYNNHKGDAKANLTIQLVNGPSIREDYEQSAVLLTCKRNATETQDFNEKRTFTSKE